MLKWGAGICSPDQTRTTVWKPPFTDPRNPMVCMPVAFHENDGNHENKGNDADNSDSYKQGAECWISGSHGNHGNQMTKTMRIEGVNCFPCLDGACPVKTALSLWNC